MLSSYNKNRGDDKLLINNQIEWYYINYPITFPCKVISAMDSAFGKFPDSEDDLEEVEEIYSVQSSIVLEMSEFLKTVFHYMPIFYFDRDFGLFI